MRSNDTLVEDEDDETDDAEETFDLADQLAKAGAPSAILQAVQARTADAVEGAEKEVECFELWEESLPTFTFFQSLCKLGQWDYAIGMASAHRLGIPAERIVAMMQAKGIKAKERPRLFEEIEEMVYAVRLADARIQELKKRKKDRGQQSPT